MRSETTRICAVTERGTNAKRTGIEKSDTGPDAHMMSIMTGVQRITEALDIAPKITTGTIAALTVATMKIGRRGYFIHAVDERPARRNRTGAASKPQTRMPSAIVALKRAGLDKTV